MPMSESRRVVLFSVDDTALLADAMRVRFAVFVEEQRVPADEEIDDHDRDDRDAVHAIARAGATVAAAGRFYRAADGSARVGRMAVAREHRGSGFGSLVLAALVDEAGRRGYARVTLHAQDHAVGFYLHHGFGPVGETLIDAGIVHQPMERRLERK